MTKKLIIFDYDGVIIDSELSCFKFYQERLKDYDINIPNNFFKYKASKKSMFFFKDLASKLNIEMNDEFIKQIINEKRQSFLKNPEKYICLMNGVIEFLDKLTCLKIKLCIASQNEKDFIQSTLELFNLEKYFLFFISHEDLTNLRPHPEIILKALDKANIPSNETVLIDDSISGIIAGKRAKVSTIGILGSVSKKEMIKVTPDSIIKGYSEANKIFNIMGIPQ
jgi:HAD superfamily hydrolase (TIGR01509 family)